MSRVPIRQLFRRARRPHLGGEDWLDYQEWLRDRVAARRSQAAPVANITISVITPVFDPPQAIFRETAASVLRQTYQRWEWVVVDNASTDHLVRELLDEIARDDRVRVIRSTTNLGILGGMRNGLEKSRGDIVVPLDHDDLLLDDALEIVSRFLAEHRDARFIYSDEDVLLGDRPTAPYFRPDWDPILNLCTSYVFHLCAFRREEALALGVFTDRDAEYVQDWDTLLRFLDNGAEPLHVAEVLYHWRSHQASSTHRTDPVAGSLDSQRHVLTRWLAKQRHPELYELESFPISRGAPELWIRRRRTQPARIDAVVMGGSPTAAQQAIARLQDSTSYPFASLNIVAVESLHTLTRAIAGLRNDLVAVISTRVEPEGSEWPWETQALAELHPDVVLISGRILNSDRIVVAGGEVFEPDGSAICPDYGRGERDPGPWALSLKQRSAGACHPAFFIAQRSFLAEALEALPAGATPRCLGAWLGAAALRAGGRIAFSPLVQAVASGDFSGRQGFSSEEREAFLASAPSLPAPERWYPPGLTAFGPARR